MSLRRMLKRVYKWVIWEYKYRGINIDERGTLLAEEVNKCTARLASLAVRLSTPHDLLPPDYQDQRPEHRAHAVRGHRGRRPPSLKKGGRSEARQGRHGAPSASLGLSLIHISEPRDRG